MNSTHFKEIEKMKDPVILVLRERKPNKVKALIYEYAEGLNSAAVVKSDSFYKIKEEIQKNTDLVFIPRTSSDSKSFWGCWIR